MDGGTPHLPKCAQVEGGDQESPLGRHIGKATQQESPCALLLLDDSENWLDQLLSQPVAFFGSRGGHPGAMAS